MGTVVTPELRSLTQAAAFIAELASQCSRERGVFDLVLAGGRTPRRVYAELAAPGLGVPWDKVRVFWGDERFVPPDHPESNFRMAREALLHRVPLPAGRVFPVPTDAANPEEAAASYEHTLRQLFAAPPLETAPGESPPRPRFDLVLLGIGPDGHTASLFPGGPECEEQQRWVVASRAPAGTAVRDRVTLTLPVLNSARVVAFLAVGAEKRAVLEQLFAAAAETDSDGAAPARPERRRPPQLQLPARRVRPATGRVLWFIDP